MKLGKPSVSSVLAGHDFVIDIQKVDNLVDTSVCQLLFTHIFADTSAADKIRDEPRRSAYISLRRFLRPQVIDDAVIMRRRIANLPDTVKTPSVNRRLPAGFCCIKCNKVFQIMGNSRICNRITAG